MDQDKTGAVGITDFMKLGTTVRRQLGDGVITHGQRGTNRPPYGGVVKCHTLCHLGSFDEPSVLIYVVHSPLLT